MWRSRDWIRHARAAGRPCEPALGGPRAAAPRRVGDGRRGGGADPSGAPARDAGGPNLRPLPGQDRAARAPAPVGRARYRRRRRGARPSGHSRSAGPEAIRPRAFLCRLWGVRTPVLDAFRPAVHALCRAWFGLELVGVERIPTSGPLIVTPNHQTYADPPLVTIPIRRRVYYMAWNRLFDVPGLAWMIRRLRAFPVEIEASGARATREAVRLLQAGHVLMIFPEGERSRDGAIGRFKPGAFRLAASLGVPPLPGPNPAPPLGWAPRPGRLRA